MGDAIALGLAEAGADVADNISVENMIDEVVGEFGKIDIMVNNAGIVTVAPSEDMKEKMYGIKWLPKKTKAK